jgi:hypothetical protein
MTFYKIVQDDVVVEASPALLIWDSKQRILLSCDIDHAQFVQSRDGLVLYHAVWMKSVSNFDGEYEMAEITAIDRDEYDEIIALLDDGTTVPSDPVVDEEPEPEPEPVEEVVEEEKPMTISEMRAKIKELTELVNHLVAMTGDEQHVD